MDLICLLISPVPVHCFSITFKKKRDCTIHEAKTKALVSFAITAKMIGVLVFAYAKNRFSHDAAQSAFTCILPLFMLSQVVIYAFESSQ